MSNWWAQKLAGASKPPPSVPANVPAYRGPAPAEPVRRQQPPPRVEERCPQCDSTNYSSAPGSTYKRCFDCGFPVTQSGTGVSGLNSEAPVKKAKQIETEYRPNQIIGKVDG